jgi:putative spermidine/putrescine transport system permease protein
MIPSSPLESDHSAGGSPQRTPRFSFAPRLLPRWLGLLPFLLFVGVFLLWPTLGLFRLALQPTKGSTEIAMREAVTGSYLDSFVYSVKLSALSAVLGVVLGSVLTAAVLRAERPRWLRDAAVSFAGVAANLGGIPLAFAFLAALGTQGLVTKILDYFGVNLLDAGFSISNFAGITIVYLYFQIPLMMLIMLPAFDGLRPVWRAAAASLGASPLRYWRHVGLPILAPALQGGFLLLFANAFSAYATAYALSSGGARLIPVQIRFFLQGNTITGKDNLGYAMAAWMILIMAVTMAAYLVLRRRSERWQR